MSSTIISIGTAVPENQIPQKRVVEFMAKAHGFSGSDAVRLKALYRATAIENRYTVIPDYAQSHSDAYEFYGANDLLEPLPSTKSRGEVYRKEALKLSVRSAQEAFEQSTLQASEITHLITISCTGMYAPGLDIDLVKGLGLPGSVQRTCINFMGCYAAFIGLKNAGAIVKSDPTAKVLVVATELCTIHFQKEWSEDNLIANSIFGDGSAAVLLSSNPKDSKNEVQLSPIAFHNMLYPEGETEMAWNIGDFGFEMKLSSYVPDLIEKGIADLVQELKSKVDVSHTEHFAIHPGGKRILEVIEQELKIDKAQDWPGRETLKEYGNMSSPTVLFAMKKLMDSLTESNQKEHVLSLAFGPGLTVESMMLEVV